jgi:hypothetical protein
VPGAQEWRTSTYSYNKAAIKTLPTAAETTNTLLEQYSVLKRTGDTPVSRTAIAKRRKDPNKMYVSRAGVKDFGDRVRIDAYLYDGKLPKKALEAKKESKEANSRPGRARVPGGGGPAPQ